jgi:hypothetical protein
MRKRLENSRMDKSCINLNLHVVIHSSDDLLSVGVNSKCIELRAEVLLHASLDCGCDFLYFCIAWTGVTMCSHCHF